MRATGFVAALLLAPGLAAQSPKIPLVTGLHCDWAFRGDSVEGDYTPWIEISAADQSKVKVLMHASKPGAGGRRDNITMDALMLRPAIATARAYRQVWITTDPEFITGTTSMVVSTAVLNDVMTKGSTSITIDDEHDLSNLPEQVASTTSGFASLAKALMGDSDAATSTPYSGTLTRVEPGLVPFSVIVNDHATTVPSVHVKGILAHDGDKDEVDMQILADPSFPLVLRNEGNLRRGSKVIMGGRIVSISFPDSGKFRKLEDDLAARRPVEIYDIYFDYNSAVIKPESDSTLRAIGQIMQRHPDWKLRVVGHTDSIGGSGQGNRILSERRATAVKETLGQRYGVTANRLDPGGAGDSQPLATNATLEGRARNRRVELIRE